MVGHFMLKIFWSMPNKNYMPCFDQTTIKSSIAPTWCPGCGDFMILSSLQKALVELQTPKEEVVLVYGIGCSGNMADFNATYGLHALHGRAIANAIGIKLANHKLKVIVIAGDGDLYGEGLNHLVAGMRGNHDLTVLVHDNARYSLTTGQTAPTTQAGTKTKSTPTGAIEQTFNPIMTALTFGASFVARGYTAQPVELTQLIKAGITHHGFALLDIFQLCPTFNKEQTHPWFAERVYNLQTEKHDASNKAEAWTLAMTETKLPLGIIYQDKTSVAYHEKVFKQLDLSLIDRQTNTVELSSALEELS